MNNSERDRQYPDRINYDYYWRVARGQYRIDVCKENVKEIFGSPDKISSSAQFRSGKTFEVCVAMIYIPYANWAGSVSIKTRVFFCSAGFYFTAVSLKKCLTVCRVSSKIVNISFLCAKADRKVVNPHREVEALMSRALSQLIMFFYDLLCLWKPSLAESRRMKARAARPPVGRS